MRPWGVVGRPPASFVHVVPPSVVLWMPLPGAAFDQLPRPALHVVHRRVERVGIAAVDDEIDRAGLVVDVEHLRPGLAAVDRLEHAALLVGGPQVAHRRDVDDVGVGRVDRRCARCARSPAGPCAATSCRRRSTCRRRRPGTQTRTLEASPVPTQTMFSFDGATATAADRSRHCPVRRPARTSSRCWWSSRRPP